MGGDKATVRFEGERLAERASRLLRQVCGDVVVASGDGRRLGWLGLPQVADPIPDAGPLAGIVAGLEAARTDLVAVVAVDMPFASPGVLRLLAERIGDRPAAVPLTLEGTQPLHAVYARAAAPTLRAALEAGERSVRRAVDALGALVVEPGEWRAVDPTGRFAWNVNRPEDLPPEWPNG
jgi:molybdopterin-guanine dinucleotide biosynthesis protein A